MFTINGNLTGFTQYEQGYSLTNPNMKAGDMVCFASGSGEAARAMAKEVEGVVLVEVPNILLGYTANVTATFEDGSDYTSFTVAPAPVPEGGWKPTFNEYKVGSAKVINGTVCDEDGNVVVSGGGGAVDMSEYFETVDADTLTWDGNTEGKISVADMLYKISDNVLSVDDLANGGSLVAEGSTVEFDSTAIIDLTIDGLALITINELVWFTLEDNVDMDGLVFPEKGTYFMRNVSAFTVNNYTGFGKTFLKEEYLPSTMFYINNSVANDTYLYTDSACTTKATKADVKKALTGKMILKFSTRDTFYMPITVATADEAGAQLDYAVVIVYNINDIYRLYTAEYTG